MQNPSRCYLPPTWFQLASLTRIHEVVIKHWSPHVIPCDVEQWNKKRSFIILHAPRLEAWLLRKREESWHGPCCRPAAAMRWEDGGIRPSLGGETLVTDSWDVNGVFVWGLMNDGVGGGDFCHLRFGFMCVTAEWTPSCVNMMSWA